MDTPRIIFEDNHLLVAYKPRGYLSQSDGSDAPDMLTFLKAYLKEKYNKPGNVFLGLVHRLDRNVCGIMVFAKTSKCASRLSKQIRENKFHKGYKALVSGKLDGEGKLVNYLFKDTKTNTTTVFDKETEGAKYSELRYKVLNFDGKNTEVEIMLVTGRSHQIRAQFSHIGHPLVGDTKYGGPACPEGIMLEAFCLSFYHPVSGELMEFGGE